MTEQDDFAPFHTILLAFTGRRLRERRFVTLQNIIFRLAIAAKDEIIQRLERARRITIITLRAAIMID